MLNNAQAKIQQIGQGSANQGIPTSNAMTQAKQTSTSVPQNLFNNPSPKNGAASGKPPLAGMRASQTNIAAPQIPPATNS